MRVDETHQSVGDIVELTAHGVTQIGQYPNIYSEDNRPVSVSERNWNAWHISALWIGIMVSIPVYMLASGLVSSGMSWWQALITIVLGHTLVMIPAVALGHFGTRYGTNFPLLSKLTFGPKGNVFPTLVRAFLGCFWFGMQSWIGGIALHSILHLMLPFWGSDFAFQFISFLLFLGLNVWVAYSGAHAIKWMESFLAPVLIIMCLIVVFWAISVAGDMQTLLAAPVAQSNGEGFWKLFFPALTAMIAFDSTIALNMSDFTRHTKTQRSQFLGQFLGAPLMTAFIVFVGICGTVGAQLHFGEALWNPADLVARFENPFVVVIFSILIVLAALTTNVAANLVPPGIVFSSLWPKLFSYKRAILLVGLLAVISLPWKILADPDSYIFQFNGTIATFLGPMTGIYLAVYWAQYKGQVNLVDLYRTDAGVYHYQRGWNIRGLVILFATTVFVLAGKFIPQLQIVYESSYVFGVIISFIAYVGLGYKRTA